MGKRLKVKIHAELDVIVDDTTTIDEDEYFEWLGDSEHTEDSLAEYLEDYDIDLTWADVEYVKEFIPQLVDPIRDPSKEQQLHQEEALF